MFVNDLMFIVVSYLVLLLCVLLSVAFFTLFERKILGYIQIRKGPNKTGYLGLIQPFSDAIKLFSKEQVKPFMSNYFLYYFSPFFSMMVSLVLWVSFPVFSYFLNFDLSILFIFCFSSLGVYGIFMAGWSSNSSYSLLGGLRSIAQTISYEVSLIMIILSVIFFTMSLNVQKLFLFQLNLWFIFLFFPLGVILYSTFLAETNRTPFDLSEGESELVSGFNTEYSSGSFALIFLAEYSSIMFMSMLFTMFMLGGNYYSFFFMQSLLLLVFMWILIRGSLPRFRYDHLMSMAWMSYLPISMFFMIFYYNLIFLMLN
uniref:NADH-ubiquinone oxidoreductase chain 1 n=1 Tax=Imatidium capense TaxID=294609 RepID=U3L046_9CUCU|nr:NADH dehydrogenase subunit 1 [Imatidium capense]